LGIRQILELLLGEEGKRKMALRQKTNRELFALYDGELVLRNRSSRGLHEARRTLQHFHDYLGEFPPSVELAKSFLSQFGSRKATTLARYTQVVKGFMKWYGEPLDITIKIPKTLPDYVEQGDVDKLVNAMRAENKKSHKKSARRDILLVDLILHTGLRRAEAAALKVGDIDTDRQLLIVRMGKGGKDRTIPLSYETSLRLGDFIRGRPKEEKVFELAASSISGKIKRFADKAGVKLHTHSLRDAFGTQLLERGATIREVQELLGHANLAVTERYTLLTSKHLRKAVDLLDDHDKPQPTMGAETLTVTVPRLGKKQTKRQQRRAEELEKELMPELFGGRRYVKSVSASRTD
jgi:site-specific recombinase XerD